MSSGSDVVNVVACEGGSVSVPRYGPVRFKRDREMDLHMSIEALFIGANKAAAATKTDYVDAFQSAFLLIHVNEPKKKKKKNVPNHSIAAVHTICDRLQAGLGLSPGLVHCSDEFPGKRGRGECGARPSPTRRFRGDQSDSARTRLVWLRGAKRIKMLMGTRVFL